MSAYISALRYALLNVVLCIFIVAMAVGGDWIWMSYIAVLVGSCVFDEGIGDSIKDLNPVSQWVYNFNLYATLPLLIVLTILYLHHLTTADPFGFVHALSLLGIEFRSEAANNSWGLTIAATFGTGYFYALAGMTVAHELSHRTSAAARIACRGLLAFTLNTAFAIAHVHGHHRNVATYRDPGSARRGEYILMFSVRCSAGQQVEAFQLEAARLRRKGLSVLSWHNRAIRDQLYTLAIYVAAALIAGVSGVIGFTLAAIIGMLLQKFVDYSQHYGLVRVEGSPVEERHAWDCRRMLSNALQYNLPLHAQHHRAARLPFWALAATEGAPRLPCGYQTASYIALIPPLWHRLIDPILADWDERLANDAERALVRQRGWETAPRAKQAAQSAPQAAADHV